MLGIKSLSLSKQKRTTFTKKLEGSALDSATIDLLRFPMALFVIFIHMPFMPTAPVWAEFPLLSGWGIYNFITVVFMRVVAQIAVPVFFLISGFLFFRNMQEWSWGKYREKLKTRVRTLLIPYILWTTLLLVILALPTFLRWLTGNGLFSEFIDRISGFSWHMYWDSKPWTWESSHLDWLGNQVRAGSPEIGPLWFLRDLIIMIAASPIIYFIVRKGGIFTMLVLGLCYVSRIWFPVEEGQITSVFYYTLGAWLSINSICLTNWVHRHRRLIVSTVVVLLIPCAWYAGKVTPVGQNIYPFFVLAGTLCAFYIAACCIKRYNLRANRVLISSCFFIYAVHLLPIPAIFSPLRQCYSFLLRIFGHGIGDLAAFLTTPILCACLCTAIYLIGKRFFPKITGVLSGSR